VTADLDDEVVQRKVFGGVHGAFCVTFFWAHFSPEKELAEATNMAHAAKAAWDNFIHLGMEPKPGPDGKLAITMPMGDKKLPGIAAEDIGRCAYGIFKAGGEYIGKTVGVAGEHLTGAQMAAALSKALGRDIRYNDVPPEVFHGFGFPGAEDLGWRPTRTVSLCDSLALTGRRRQRRRADSLNHRRADWVRAPRSGHHRTGH
jgi:uncharacterized protein YbjT (DUF2867 family)